MNGKERVKMSGKRKCGIRKAAALLAVIVIIGMTLCGCSTVFKRIYKMTYIETSEKYMVGFDYSSYKDVFGMAPVIQCTVRYDKSIDATFSWTGQDNEPTSRTLNFALTDSHFSNISQNINPQEIYRLNPKCSDPADVCDGGDSWLYVYGPDDAVLKSCGGFCPTSDRFHEIRRLLFDNLPEDLEEFYSQYEEIYDTQFSEGIPQMDERLQALFEEAGVKYSE